MPNFAKELEAVMESRNFYIRGKINYSLPFVWQRFRDVHNPHGGAALFVLLHDDRGATFGDWHYPSDWHTHWFSAYSKPSSYQLEEYKREIKYRQREQMMDRGKREMRAQDFFNKRYLHCADRHPYVLRKFIDPHIALQCRSWLVIPIRDIDYDLVTVQIIKPDGFKRLWKGTTYKNNMVWLCDELDDNYNGVLRICEGYATGCTIRSITKNPVVCTLSASNMPVVAHLLRRKFPSVILKICADDDQWGKENIGFSAAVEADILSNATIYAPDFTDLDVSEKPTDFNDLYCLAGAKEVRRQLILIRKYT